MFGNIQEGLDFLKNFTLKELVADFLMVEATSSYIGLFGKPVADPACKPQDLDSYIKDFLKLGSKKADDDEARDSANPSLSDNRGSKVMLLLGDAGSGKSLYCQQLTIWLWNEYQKTGVIPIYISLGSCKNHVRIIEETLENHGFSIDQIMELKASKSFVFILDGYDELNQLQNIYMSNKLEEWRTKVIITCRKTYLYDVTDFGKYFVPYSAGRRQEHLLRQCFVEPFNQTQIETYLKAHNKQKHIALSYTEICCIPGLLNLINIPLFLHMAVNSIADIYSKYPPGNPVSISQASLYDMFIDNWFEREADKLNSTTQTAKSLDLQSIFWQFCKIIALAMHKRNSIAINIGEELDIILAENNWIRKFPEIKIEWLIHACPLHEVMKNQYSFLNASFIEYFTAREIYDESLVYQTLRIPSPVPDPDEATDLTSLIKYLIHEDELKKDLIYQFLFARNQQMIVFEVGRICDAAHRKWLFSIVEKSKIDKRYEIGAANAITILNKAGISLSGLDFQNIAISGADLSGGILEGTKFNGAILNNVKFSGAWLVDTDFTNASMHGVEFEEFPSLKLKNAKSCCYSLDGNYLAIAHNNYISIYDARTKTFLVTLRGHTESVTEIIFGIYEDRHIIASCSNDKTIRIWDVASKKLAKVLWAGSAILSIAFSYDNTNLASGSNEGEIAIWDLGGTMHNVLEIAVLDGSVEYTRFVKVGMIKAQDETLIVPRVLIGDTVGLPLFKFCGESELNITAVAFSPDGQHVVCGDNSRNIQLFDIKDRTHVATFEKISAGRRQPHDDGAAQINLENLFERNDMGENVIWDIVYSPDGKFIIVASGEITRSDDSSIKIFDVNTRKLVRTLEGHTFIPRSFALSRNGLNIISGGNDKSLKLWDLQTGTLVRTLYGHKDNIMKVSFSPNGDEIVSLSADGMIKFWQVNDRLELQLSKKQGHIQAVLSVAIDSNAKIIASASYDGTIKLWDLDTGTNFRTLYGHALGVTGIDFSPDCLMLASSGVDKSTKLWDLRSGNIKFNLNIFDDSVECVEFSRGSSLVSYGGAGGKILVMDILSKEYYELQIKTDLPFISHDFINSVAFSSDSRLLVAASKVRGVLLWDLQSKTLIRMFEQLKYGWSVAFSPNDAKFALGGDGANVLICDILKNYQIRVLKSHTSTVTSVKFLSNTQLVSGSKDGTLKFWDIDTGQCIFTKMLYTPIRGIAVRDYGEKKHLVTGTEDNAVSCWLVENNHGRIDIKLQWSSREGLLVATNAKLTEITGLSEINKRLLTQLSSVSDMSNDDNISLSDEEEEEIDLLPKTDQVRQARLLGQKMLQNSLESSETSKANLMLKSFASQQQRNDLTTPLLKKEELDINCCNNRCVML